MDGVEREWNGQSGRNSSDGCTGQQGRCVRKMEGGAQCELQKGDGE